MRINTPVVDEDRPDDSLTLAEERRMMRDQFSPRAQMRDVRAMITGALYDLGGQSWLKKQAQRHPIAFLSLLGRCLPIEARQQDPTTIRFIIETVDTAEATEHVPGVLNTPLKLVHPAVDDPDTVEG